MLPRITALQLKARNTSVRLMWLAVSRCCLNLFIRRQLPPQQLTTLRHNNMEATAPKPITKENPNISTRISTSFKKFKDRTRAKMHDIAKEHRSSNIAVYQNSNAGMFALIVCMDMLTMSLMFKQ
jgi:hypothetical protein